MKQLDTYEAIVKEIHDYFGYVEDWRVIPLDDARDYYWKVDNESVGYAKTVEDLRDQDGDYYEDEIYMQRHLPKWVYRGAEFTMICCNPHVDGNVFLRIFDNSKECP